MEVFSNISSNLPPHTTPWRCHPSFSFSPCEACLLQDLWLCLWEEKVSCSREQQQNKSSRVNPRCCSPQQLPVAVRVALPGSQGGQCPLGCHPFCWHRPLAEGHGFSSVPSEALGVPAASWPSHQGSFGPTPTGQCGWRGDSQHPTLCSAPGSLLTVPKVAQENLCTSSCPSSTQVLLLETLAD